MVENITLKLTVDEAIFVFAALQLLDKPATAKMADGVKNRIREKLLVNVGKES
jgi:hypothetical protein|tara:strand:+ start:29637 stop:29795 length:159 start_codon:yes stop_codon:yes gene_type:complete